MAFGTGADGFGWIAPTFSLDMAMEGGAGVAGVTAVVPPVEVVGNFDSVEVTAAVTIDG
jgi:hypothetical protein